MDESSKDDPQNVALSDAIALTRKALRNTHQNLRDSDLLLKRAKTLPTHADEVPPDDQAAQDE